MQRNFIEAKVIPVLMFPDVEYAAPTATALVAGGLSVLEVTLRTDAAWDSLKAISQATPTAVVGVGTVLEPKQISRAKEAGAKFCVSPGFDERLVESAKENEIFYLPGVATATEIMAARRSGLEFLKFFPAEASGGRPLLKSLASPFQGITFCPTGGVGPDNLGEYLSLNNVACVGGSWMASIADMEAANWQLIEEKARTACKIASQPN